MAKQPESILDFDISKIFGDFKVPGIDVDILVSSQRKNIEALTQANKLAFEGVQAVFKRQVEILRQSIEEAAAAAQQLTGPGSPQEKAIRQTELVKEAFEHALANSRELSEIVAKSNAEAFEQLNKRFTQLLDEVKDSIAKVKA
ncbi:MAG: phasin family protein [Telmatospirillum sp.]|nr:phasin family protein [Telmatospirillum sp.]